ncbi:S41 family peptidase [Marinifilum sp.]|uniref:S41 family peptidase n=1 Tax=Marinifilum sp. TaxID=2033137 RepID=UPI003BA919CB
MNKKYKFIIPVVAIFSALTSSAQTSENHLKLLNPLSIITKDDLLKDKNALKKFHPGVFKNFSERKYDSLIEAVSITLPKDSVTETQKSLIRRKVLDIIMYEDPHLRFVPKLTTVSGKKLNFKSIKVLPCDFLCINDTLLVHKSYSPSINKGDRIICINGENSKDYLNSSYRDRYSPAILLQAPHHLKFSHSYNLLIERDGKRKVINVDGISLTKTIYNKAPFFEQVFSDFETGYFRISNFDFNKHLVTRLRRFLKKLERDNITNLIIDIRENKGGSGDRFDEIFSMLSNKKKLIYQSDAKIKISNDNYKEYNFNKDMIGEVVSLPEKELVKEFALDSTKLIGEIDCFVLVSRDTGSVAASFANIMNYNNIGTLVGEPLSHNALKYGDVIIAKRDNSRWVISTIEYVEHSNSQDGILYPDIYIPFKANEYLKGGDPVLEECLDLIKANSKEN